LVTQQEQEFMDATELLKKDHDAVKQLFAEFESAELEQDRLDVYDEIREQLLIHARIEEEIFYPAVRETNSDKSATQVDEALSEHQQVKEMLDKLDDMAAEVDADFAETIRTLAESVEHHVQEEENEIFVSARKLGDERLSELGDRLQQRKDQLMEAGSDQEEQSV
jgi:iron-sulfur cluster repair protein YtfE (RIC family)